VAAKQPPKNVKVLAILRLLLNITLVNFIIVSLADMDIFGILK